MTTTSRDRVTGLDSVTRNDAREEVVPGSAADWADRRSRRSSPSTGHPRARPSCPIACGPQPRGCGASELQAEEVVGDCHCWSDNMWLGRPLRKDKSPLLDDVNEHALVRAPRPRGRRGNSRSWRLSEGRHVCVTGPGNDTVANGMQCEVRLLQGGASCRKREMKALVGRRIPRGSTPRTMDESSFARTSSFSWTVSRSRFGSSGRSQSQAPSS